MEMNAGDELDLEAFQQKMYARGRWVFVVPVSGVILTEAVRHEFLIKRVLLVAQKKLPRIRRRLGIPQRISELKRRFRDDFFDSAQTFAVLRYSGRPSELRGECLRTVRDELAILAVSQLGYGRRRLGSCPAIKGEPTAGRIEHLLIDAEDARVLAQYSTVGKPDTLMLSGLWKSYHRQFFFHNLLRVLRGDTGVSSAWRDDLQRAAILIGQSQCSSDVAQSFLWNMIALEILLTEQGDKYANALPARAGAFIGWVGFWETDDYPARIADLYNKRCALVHSGRWHNISIQDLLFTDDLLFNLLSNLIRHIDRFPSKEAVLDFSRKVQAEHTLGIKPRIRPRTLTFVSRSYTRRDLKAI